MLKTVQNAMQARFQDYQVLNIGAVNRNANDTGTAASQMLAAGELSRQSEQLTGKVKTFVTQVRAA